MNKDLIDLGQVGRDDKFNNFVSRNHDINNEGKKLNGVMKKSYCFSTPDDIANN